MKCPVQLACDLSACGGWELRHSEGRRQDARILNDRLGAGDESPRGDFASDGEAAHLVAGGGDYRDLGPQHAALEAALRGAWIRRAVGPAAGQAQSEACAAEDGRGGAAALWGEVRGPERAALSGEAAGGARHRTKLHLGEAGAARRGASQEGEEAGRAPQAAGASAATRDAAPPGWQSASVVSGPALV